MKISPNTNIKILSNVPLDSDYNNTIYFSSKEYQTSYFTGKAKYALDNNTYQRINRGYIRVGINAENLYNCNYLMFQNASFGSKWFYAFITSVEYVNNAVSEIAFEIDVMQTWHFDYELLQCFIEREHSASDQIGDNIVPENLALGEYVVQDVQSVGLKNKLCYNVDISIDKNYDDWGGGYYTINDKSVYSGLYIASFKNVTDLNEYLWGRYNTSGADNEKLNKQKVQQNISNIRIGFPNAERYTFNYTGDINKLNGYTPKNKKMLTAPFIQLYATNLNGSTAIYPLEFFSGRTPSFKVTYDSQPKSPAFITPQNYKSVGFNSDESLFLSDFPVVSYRSDVYDQWLAENQRTTPLKLAGTLGAGFLAGAVSANPVGVAVGVGSSVISTVTNTLASGATASLQPPQNVSNSCGLSLYWEDMIDIQVMTKTITYDVAKTIDDYFSVYGYATRRVKKPNRNVRPHWTYTKTIGCNIKGNLPVDDIKKICAIFDKGITFWVNGNEIGNYSLNNSL